MSAYTDLSLLYYALYSIEHYFIYYYVIKFFNANHSLILDIKINKKKNTDKCDENQHNIEY